MLIHDFKAIFVHVPKTAGQSIEHAILEQLGENWKARHKYLLCINDDPTAGPPRMAHLTAVEYRDLGHVTQTQFAAYFKFGFVRNPWARLVSEYRFRSSLIRTSFRRWLLERFPQPGFDDMWRHVMPQSDYLFNCDGSAAVDFIGRFETLARDYRLVSEQLGVQLPALKKVNNSSDRPLRSRLRQSGLLKGMRNVLGETPQKTLHSAPSHWQQYYDDDTRKFVARFYAEDIERFGYRFDS